MGENVGSEVSLQVACTGGNATFELFMRQFLVPELGDCEGVPFLMLKAWLEKGDSVASILGCVESTLELQTGMCFNHSLIQWSPFKAKN